MSKYIFIGTLLFFSISLSAQHVLKAEITELRNNNGVVSIELLDENNNSIMGSSEMIKANNCVITFNDLEDGKYALRYFHDENSNKELDKNFLGMPKEGIGFSNDAYGRFGPKDFEEWLFEVKGDTQTTLRTKYY